MKQLWSLLFFVSVLLAPPVHAQQTSPVRTRHALWKVQGKTNSVYLFGSIHFLKKEFYPLPSPIEGAYKKSDIVVFETDLRKMESAEQRGKMAAITRLPENDSLKQHLTKATYAKLNSYLTNSGAPGNALDAYRPWVAAVGILGMELTKLGYDPEEGVDKYFLGKAEKDHKQVVSLETPESQLGLFGSLSKEEEEAMMSETLGEISTFKQLLSEMVHAWETGNPEEIDKFIGEQMRAFPELQKKLLLDRNTKWISTLEKLLKDEKDVFVVVGAAHLVGAESVVELLQKKGFKVEQL